MKEGVLFLFHVNPRNYNPRNFQFLVSFSYKTIFPLSPYVTTLLSEDVEFSYASFGLYEKFIQECPPTQMPMKKLKIGISMFSSQEIGSSSISFQMIIQVLQSEILRFKFYLLC